MYPGAPMVHAFGEAPMRIRVMCDTRPWAIRPYRRIRVFGADAICPALQGRSGVLRHPPSVQ
eukprot:500437-Pyramimonas_sp.AAC.1